MDFLRQLVDVFLHLDHHLAEVIARFGAGSYLILFAIIFAETGLVVTPFLPGDSLLFAAGALAGIDLLDPVWTAAVVLAAAVAGDSVNYAIGRRLGPRVFRATDTTSLLHRMLNREHLDRAHAFFEKHGGKAVVLARFAPIIRTFVPFVAGAAAMSPTVFFLYNVVGAVAWVTVCVGGGYLFGNIPIVKEHFSLVTLGIIAVSLIPFVLQFTRRRAA